jgi:PleD family two-component response regulator
MSEELKKQTILIISDDISSIRILVPALVFDYNVNSAFDVRRGIDLAIEKHPDLILLDTVMPEMSGYRVCERLKSDERTMDISVIFMASRDELRGYEAGGVDYIIKPLNPVITKRRIKTYLELKKQTDFLRWMLRERPREMQEMEKEYTKP